MCVAGTFFVSVEWELQRVFLLNLWPLHTPTNAPFQHTVSPKFLAPKRLCVCVCMLVCEASSQWVHTELPAAYNL